MLELSGIRGIGPTRLEALRAVGICSLRDLLYALPLRYEDRTTPLPCAEAPEGPALLKGTVCEAPKLNRFKGLTRVSAKLRDDSGTIPLVWFNQPWVTQQLTQGQSVMLYGRVTVHNGFRSLNSGVIVTEPAIEPVYKPVAGFQPKSFRKLMETALAHAEELADPLPEEVLQLHGLPPLTEALRQAHFPESVEQLQRARRRLAFEQMLMYFALLSGMGSSRPAGYPMEIPEDAAERFFATLPFPPTGAQRRVLNEVLEDLRKDTAMSRLVQGDVGCGKTALAFGAIYAACGAGFQCAMMAPTEILAQQHCQSAREMLEPLGIRCGLLTGSMKAS